MVSYTHQTDPVPFLVGGGGVGLDAAGVCLALWQRRRKADKPAFPIDAPHWTKERKSDRALVGKSLLVNRPREELFAAWDVKRFPEFMENVVAVEEAGDGISRWTIKGPAGREITLVNRDRKSTRLNSSH